LNNTGLNPKTQITNKHVTNVVIMEVFGESKVHRTTNLAWNPTTKLELLYAYIRSAVATTMWPTMNSINGLSKVTLFKRKV
jgi:hypothetical protein